MDPLGRSSCACRKSRHKKRISITVEAVMRLLNGACKDAGMTAIVVTHDAQLASWADRVVFIRDGAITDQTAPAAGPEFLLALGQGQSVPPSWTSPRQNDLPAVASRLAAPWCAGRSGWCAANGSRC
jgi:hypothetical protein